LLTITIKVVFEPVLAVVVGALNRTGTLGLLPANSVFVHVEGYRMVILLSVFA
jgi:hypothetical protein